MAVRVRRWSDVEARPQCCRHGGHDAHGSNHAHGASVASVSPAGRPVRRASVDGAASNNNLVTVSMMNGTAVAPPPSAQVEEAEECVICLDELVPGKALFTAECGHKFHFSCVLENVNHDEANSDKCPICRKSQSQWPEQTKGLVKAHPYCTNCGKRGTGGQYCDGCGHSLAHTPTAQERARAAAAAAAARSNVVVECPTCRIRCLVSTSARGTLQCPNGHLFQVRMPASSNSNSMRGSQANIMGSSSGRQSLSSTTTRPVMRMCPTCSTRVQMPPGSQAGQYMCPLGHTFFYDPRQT
ncbi:hypothetical protein Poli38472_007794 [Pythium oligandrum]|uniref:RING-type domain-containing protein n=1 Tax=Pythium oligandrum TaxID=41045 RepID=A0A8K1CQU4_PYTOL|nr:hypothetical protein Poli38472_007794 [Pythium oligandrum]|eukprot:TMW68122.1 hypothetical protein Poli38472_007794 [Pythium oligandrum]